MRGGGKEGRWEDEKVGKKQEWGMGRLGDGGMEGGRRNAEGTEKMNIEHRTSNPPEADCKHRILNGKR
jgi:hypothetical protein